MLVLTRRLNEGIVIGANIEIRVLEMHKGNVKLGFVAPREVTISRKELFDRTRTSRSLPTDAPLLPQESVC